MLGVEPSALPKQILVFYLKLFTSINPESRMKCCPLRDIAHEKVRCGGIHYDPVLRRLRQEDCHQFRPAWVWIYLKDQTTQHGEWTKLGYTLLIICPLNVGAKTDPTDCLVIDFHFGFKGSPSLLLSLLRTKGRLCMRACMCVCAEIP